MTASFFLFKAILLGLLMVLALAWISIQVACRLRLMDVPGSAPHKQHLRATPLAGGLALAATLLLSEGMFGTFADPNVRATFLAAGVIFLFGLWDDFQSIPPSVKFLGQVIAALVLIRQGVYIQIFESPEFFLRSQGVFNVYLDWLLTIIWVVGITNAFNFVDSMDGLVAGLSGLAAAFFMLVTLDAAQPLLSLHSALIVGVCVGLYFFNSPPAMLFLGDSGAQTLGFILAALAIAYRPQGANQSSSWFIPILLLGVPIFDTTLVVISRLRRKRPVYAAGRDHTYHRLLRMGLEPFRAVLFMHLAALSLGCLAFVILTQPPLYANLAFALVLLLGLGAIILLDRRKSWN